MEQNLRVLTAALDGANKAGVFNLHESATIFRALQDVTIYFQSYGEKNCDKQEPELKLTKK
jgi:hypothetical protein